MMGTLAGKERHMRLRDVELGDLSAYVRMRCNPVMMAELGGPLPREGVEEKVARDDGRWGPVHAFAGRVLRSSHWVINRPPT